MGYRLSRRDNGEFIQEFTHHYLAERYAKDHGRRCDYSIDYVKKDESEFTKESVCLFDDAVPAFEHNFIYEERNRK